MENSKLKCKVVMLPSINHKWVQEKEYAPGTKPQRCVKCGISKVWCMGDYQCWEYSWHNTFETQSGGRGISLKKSFVRPDCTNISTIKHREV